MKCRTYFLAALSAFAIAFASCDDYDDSAIREEMSGYGERLSSLEEWQKKVDSNLAALQQLIGSQDYITDVKETEEGYVISFVKSEPITLYHGEKGEKGDTGAAGEKGDTGPEGPKGDDGEAFLQGAPVLSEDGSCYVFTLLNGDTFSVAAYRSLRIGDSADNAELVLEESPQTITLTLPADYDASRYSALIAQIAPEGADGTYTHIASRAGDAGGWSVEAELPVSKDDAEVTVTSPEEGKALLRITLVRTDGSELTSARVLKKEVVGDFKEETDGSYTVYTETGLKAWMAKAEEGVNCTLAADIELDGTQWTPICYSSTSGYSGTFDGGGHTITINDFVPNGMNTYSGLFGTVGEEGVVKNCNVVADLQASEDQLVSVGGIAGKNSGSILNCSFKGSISNCPSARGGEVGGIVGYMSKGKIVACRSYVSLHSASNVGGILGSGNYTCVEACYSYVEEIDNYLGFKGGIAGTLRNESTVTACYWSKNVACQFLKQGIGYGMDDTATQVTDGNWTGEPLTKMNETLETNGYDCRYEANTGTDKDVFPLIVKEVK